MALHLLPSGAQPRYDMNSTRFAGCITSQIYPFEHIAAYGSGKVVAKKFQVKIRAQVKNLT